MSRCHRQYSESSEFGLNWTTRFLLVIACFVSFFPNGNVEAGEETVPPENSALRGEFVIGKNGRLVLLPVKFKDEDFQFLLDTGACRSGIDVSLRSSLGEPNGTQVLNTPAGRKRVETFPWPELTLAGQSLKTTRSIACIDFTELRQGSNEKIFGVIGMDVLRQCRLQIDFDRGIARFLKSLPHDRDELGMRIPIKYSEDGSPFLVGAVSKDRWDQFLIDTGAQGNSLRSEHFDQLLEQNLIRMGGSYTSVTVGGEVQGRRGQLRRLTIGPLVHEDLRVSRVNLSSLGLRYFSRYRVTFDFPESAVYFQKGANYSKAEPRATSGMALTWIDERVIVKSVKPGGPAATAGIRSDDTLVRIGGKSISEYDHFSLRQLLTSESGKKVPMIVRRADYEINIELTLMEDD